MFKAFSHLAILCAGVSAANAYEVMPVCATYVNSGKTYAVQALVASGNELNSAWNTNVLRGTKNYVVIYWDNDEATVIELSYGTPGLGAAPGEDQKGYPWAVRRGTFCFDKSPRQ